MMRQPRPGRLSTSQGGAVSRGPTPDGPHPMGAAGPPGHAVAAGPPVPARRPRRRPATATGTAPTVPAAPPIAARRRTRWPALAAVVGEAQVLTDAAARRRHAAGWSYADVLERREGPLAPPDAVVRPESADQVVAGAGGLRRAAASAVVPFGGRHQRGRRGAARSRAVRAVVTLALDRMDDVLDIDAESMTVTVQPGSDRTGAGASPGSATG